MLTSSGLLDHVNICSCVMFTERSEENKMCVFVLQVDKWQNVWSVVFKALKWADAVVMTLHWAWPLHGTLHHCCAPLGYWRCTFVVLYLLVISWLQTNGTQLRSPCNPPSTPTYTAHEHGSLLASLLWRTTVEIKESLRSCSTNWL